MWVKLKKKKSNQNRVTDLSMFELRYVSRHADRGRALLWRLGPEVAVVLVVVLLMEVVEKEAAVLPAAEAESPSDVVVAVVRCCCC